MRTLQWMTLEKVTHQMYHWAPKIGICWQLSRMETKRLNYSINSVTICMRVKFPVRPLNRYRAKEPQTKMQAFENIIRVGLLTTTKTIRNNCLSNLFQTKHNASLGNIDANAKKRQNFGKAVHFRGVSKIGASRSRVKITLGRLKPALQLSLAVVNRSYNTEIDGFML